MGQLLAYSLTSSILLACLYLVYKWALSSENYHKVNRMVVWTIYLSSLGLPLVWKTLPLVFASAPSSPVVTIDIDSIPIVAVDIEESSPSDYWIFMAVCAYLVGIGGVVMLTVANFVKLYGIIRRGEKITVDGRTVILTDNDGIAPFSFCKTIVIPRVDFQQYGQMIMMHEKSHVEFCHWLDLLFAQAVCVLQWFNPAAWLMREELKTIHEYQADDRVISSGVNVKEYQMLLIKKAVGARFPSLANSLNHSKLKKCITMMYNQNSSASRRLRGLALVPALAAAIAVTNIDAVAAVLEETSAARFLVEETSEPVAAEIRTAVSGLPSTESSAVSTREVSEKTQDSQMSPATVSVHTDNAVAAAAAETLTAAVSEGDKPSGKAAEKADAPESVYSVVQKKPEFPGGDAAVLQYISDNIHYPKEARDKKIQGRVVVRFVINKDGSVGETSVLRSADPLLDKEAMRVVSTLPAFKPGEVDGKPVSVYYVLPIGFSLKDDAGKENSDKPVVKVKSVDGKQVADVDGRKEEVKVYVDGKLYEGNLADIDPSKIESMTVDKSKEGVIRIEMKK